MFSPFFPGFPGFGAYLFTRSASIIFANSLHFLLCLGFVISFFFFRIIKLFSIFLFFFIFPMCFFIVLLVLSPACIIFILQCFSLYISSLSLFSTYNVLWYESFYSINSTFCYYFLLLSYFAHYLPNFPPSNMKSTSSSLFSISRRTLLIFVDVNIYYIRIKVFLSTYFQRLARPRPDTPTSTYFQIYHSVFRSGKHSGQGPSKIRSRRKKNGPLSVLHKEKNNSGQVAFFSPA